MPDDNLDYQSRVKLDNTLFQRFEEGLKNVEKLPKTWLGKIFYRIRNKEKIKDIEKAAQKFLEDTKPIEEELRTLKQSKNSSMAVDDKEIEQFIKGHDKHLKELNSKISQLGKDVFGDTFENLSKQTRDRSQTFYKNGTEMLALWTFQDHLNTLKESPKKDAPFSQKTEWLDKTLNILKEADKLSQEGKITLANNGSLPEVKEAIYRSFPEILDAFFHTRLLSIEHSGENETAQSYQQKQAQISAMLSKLESLTILNTVQPDKSIKELKDTFEKMNRGLPERIRDHLSANRGHLQEYERKRSETEEGILRLETQRLGDFEKVNKEEKKVEEQQEALNEKLEGFGNIQREATTEIEQMIKQLGRPDNTREYKEKLTEAMKQWEKEVTAHDQQIGKKETFRTKIDASLEEDSPEARKSQLTKKLSDLKVMRDALKDKNNEKNEINQLFEKRLPFAKDANKKDDSHWLPIARLLSERNPDGTEKEEREKRENLKFLKDYLQEYNKEHRVSLIWSEKEWKELQNKGEEWLKLNQEIPAIENALTELPQVEGELKTLIASPEQNMQYQAIIASLKTLIENLPLEDRSRKRPEDITSEDINKIRNLPANKRQLFNNFIRERDDNPAHQSPANRRHTLKSVEYRKSYSESLNETKKLMEERASLETKLSLAKHQLEVFAAESELQNEKATLEYLKKNLSTTETDLKTAKEELKNLENRIAATNTAIGKYTELSARYPLKT